MARATCPPWQTCYPVHPWRRGGNGAGPGCLAARSRAPGLMLRRWPREVIVNEAFRSRGRDGRFCFRPSVTLRKVWAGGAPSRPIRADARPRQGLSAGCVNHSLTSIKSFQNHQLEILKRASRGLRQGIFRPLAGAALSAARGLRRIVGAGCRARGCLGTARALHLIFQAFRGGGSGCQGRHRRCPVPPRSTGLSAAQMPVGTAPTM